LDTLLQHLESNETDVSIVLGRVPDGQVECAFMISKPQQEFWLRVLDEIEHRHYSPSFMFQCMSMLSSSARTLFLTGPCLLQHVVDTHLDDSSIKIYPASFFFPKEWHNTASDDRSYVSQTNTYVIHHGAGSWLTTTDRVFCNVIKLWKVHSWGFIILLLVAFVVLLLWFSKLL
jgi:hypothetical protein